MDKHPISLATRRTVPRQFSWVDQRLVRERYIDQLSHAACTLSLFLVTVADAQGLSYYADASLGQRLSMSNSALHQARQVLITQGLIAYQRPLYQVLALDAAPTGATASAPTGAADDEPVDMKAVVARIWEVWSCSTITAFARSQTFTNAKGSTPHRSRGNSPLIPAPSPTGSRKSTCGPGRPARAPANSIP